jgi:protein-S-isoprenylcysteine O-methyltransferase Ste14
MSTQTFEIAPAGVAPPADAAGSGIAQRLAVFAVGLAAYSAFFATILYSIGFVGNWFVPKSIDSGAGAAIVPVLAINTVLLSLFVVQHTIMARPWFKAWWTRLVPAAVERSVFVLASSACLGLLFWQWRPLPGILWDATDPVARVALIALSLAGWAIVFISSFLISHFDLFGLRQAYLHLRNRPYTHKAFRVIGLYKLVRHPLMVGFIIAFWATPTMTVGHLFFAIMVTLYILVGTRLEERDLVAHFGDRYLHYKRSVRALVPLPRRAP